MKNSITRKEAVKFLLKEAKKNKMRLWFKKYKQSDERLLTLTFDDKLTNILKVRDIYAVGQAFDKIFNFKLKDFPKECTNDITKDINAIFVRSKKLKKILVGEEKC